MKRIGTLKIHYYKAIWIQNGLKEQRNQHINVMDFYLFQCDKDQGLGSTKNKYERE